MEHDVHWIPSFPSILTLLNLRMASLPSLHLHLPSARHGTFSLLQTTLMYGEIVKQVQALKFDVISVDTFVILLHDPQFRSVQLTEQYYYQFM